MSTTTATASRGSHISRILVIARHAFTQLVRMKVFYFLAVFAVIAIGSNFFDLPQHEGPEAVGVNVLRSIKSWSLGTMTLFSVVLVHRGDRAAAAEGRGGPHALHDPGEAGAAHRLSGREAARSAVAGVRFARADGRADDRRCCRSAPRMVLEQQLEMAKALGWPQEAIDSLKAETAAHGPTLVAAGRGLRRVPAGVDHGLAGAADFHVFDEHAVHHDHQFPDLFHRPLPGGRAGRLSSAQGRPVKECWHDCSRWCFRWCCRISRSSTSSTR